MSDLTDLEKAQLKVLGIRLGLIAGSVLAVGIIIAILWMVANHLWNPC